MEPSNEKQVVGWTMVSEILTPVSTVTVAVLVSVQPLAAVTVTV